MKKLNSCFNYFRNKFITSLDLILFILVIGFLIYDIILMVSFFINKFTILNTDIDVMYMSSNTNSNNASSHTTSVEIMHTDAGWSSAIRQIFIYGSGAFRLSLLRSGGTPGQRAFVIASTVASEAAAKAVNNAINDPTYVSSHIDNWQKVWKNKDTLEVHIDKDSETVQKVSEVVNKFKSDGLEDFSSNLLNKVIDILRPILEPVQVDYSNTMLADQIYGLSIILFVLSVLIIGLLIAFMINVIILVYSDKLKEYFTNKYIRWYIAFNKKIIGIEICFLGGSILYFMYTLSYGIHFIATHPIIIA